MTDIPMLAICQVFVESLDRAFENVCELDLVFHFDEVRHQLAHALPNALTLPVLIGAPYPWRNNSRRSCFGDERGRNRRGRYVIL